MEKPGKTQIKEQLLEAGFLPMYSHPEQEKSLQILEALYKGGIRVVEFTNRPHDALEQFRALRRKADAEFPDLILGAGTIMNESQAGAFAEAGASFLVAPAIHAGVGSFCRGHDLFWCPGASTLNEVLAAHEAGADFVKLFPARQLGGPAYLKALLAPCPWLQLIPTGGVGTGAEELQEWIRAGAEVLGIGSRLLEPEMIRSGDMKQLADKTATILRTLKTLRKLKI
jgi:2-dehydro-3-deoxyphosphogluconate aldolase/(4S)-4-hydroxy-2-oxoglutarate aldolase